jgi:hypothetical protein
VARRKRSGRNWRLLDPENEPATEWAVVGVGFVRLPCSDRHGDGRLQADIPGVHIRSTIRTSISSYPVGGSAPIHLAIEAISIP